MSDARQHECASALEAIWATVSEIPQGQVSTYGQIAEFAGLRGRARYVGFALSQLAEGAIVPWHRVINSQGKISFPEQSERFAEQVRRLQREGVEVREGKISLKKYQWQP